MTPTPRADHAADVSAHEGRDGAAEAVTGPVAAVAPTAAVGASGLTAVVAYARGRVIGQDGEMPWRLPADLRRFKQLTMGHHLLMGRKTFESIGRPLPGRTSVVLSRTLARSPPVYGPDASSDAQVIVCDQLDEALKVARARGDLQPMVIGGGEIYRLTLPFVDRIEATEIDLKVDGDTHFPQLLPRDWLEVARQVYPATDDCPHGYAFVTLARRPGRRCDQEL